MISGIFFTGSGTGNQLHRYVMTRVLALDKNLEWGMIDTGNFKGYSFLNLDMGKPVNMEDYSFYTEKRVNNDQGVDIRGYDFEGIESVKDNTIIDGEFQGYRYYEHHRDLIDRWLEVEPIDLGENICIINFRGGEYTLYPDLFLSKEYWDKAISTMREKNPNMVFRVVTDDVETARVFFPHFEIQHEIGKDWRSIRYAKYLILSNSSFGILPAWLNTEAFVIAPKWWARHNISDGYWALSQNIYKNWYYLDRQGNFSDYDTCILELDLYNKKHDK